MKTVITVDTPIDLHMHTTYSDGRWSAEQLLDYLVQKGFGLVAVTDHDRLDSVASIQQMGRHRQLPVLAGVEISAQWHGQMGDVLCYGFDPADSALRAIADQVRQRQRANQEFTFYAPNLLDQVRAEIPLDGIEAYYPTHTPELVGTYLAYAQQHDLLIGAGSDSHGPPGRLPIKYRAELCRRLLERVEIELQ